MLTVKVKQDLSGHVCFDNQQAKFYQHSQERANRISCARKNGILKFKPSRNPLRAEATPRVDYKGFDYTPPPAVEVKERWVYPENDWGLMQKFDSQKQVYAVLEETSKKCDESIKKYQAFIKSDAHKSDISLSLDPPPSTRRSEKVLSRAELSEIDRIHMANEKMAASMAITEANSNSKAILSSIGSKSGKEHHVQALKNLRGKHPEIIEKYRADRAASFVNRQIHPLEPPTHRDMEGKVYRPAGGPAPVATVIPKAKVKSAALKKQHRSDAVANHEEHHHAKSNHMTKQEGAARVDVLRKQLQETQNEIDRQELKLAIHNPPPKSYELPKTTDKAKMSRSLDLALSPQK